MAGTYYFVGGEDHDFLKIGNATIDTATTAARRTANSRCTLKSVSGSGTVAGEGWQCAFSASASTFWLTGRFYLGTLTTGNANHFLALLSGAVRRLVLTPSTNTTSGFFRLNKINSAGTVTTLATSSTGFSANTIIKLDMFVNYAVAGQVQVYLDGVKIIDYSGDVTTDSATSLDGAVLGHPFYAGSSASQVYWSEIIATSDDTRALNLKTTAVTANGNTYTFDNGNYANVNETVTDDTGLISSGTAGQLAQFAVDASGITGTPAIRALCISARAQKGGTGPQNAKMSVRAGGIDQLSGVLALPAAMNRVSYIFTTNPNTSGPWAYSDLTAAGFNIGIRSET
jgi:hypothetical protein